MATSSILSHTKPRAWHYQPARAFASERRYLQGLLHFYPFWEGRDLEVRDPISGNIGTMENGAVWREGLFGPEVYFEQAAGAPQFDRVDLGAFATYPTQGTLMFILCKEDAVLRQRFYGNADEWEIWINGTELGNNLYAAGAGILSGGDVTIDTQHVCFFTFDSDGDATTNWLDGVRTASGNTADDAPTASTNLYVGVSRATSEPFEGSMGAYYLWERVLSDGEIMELSYDPFRFARQRRALGIGFVPAGGGDITVDNPTAAATGSSDLTYTLDIVPGAA